MPHIAVWRCALGPDPAVGHHLVVAFLDPVLAAGLARWHGEALEWQR